MSSRRRPRNAQSQRRRKHLVRIQTPKRTIVRLTTRRRTKNPPPFHLHANTFRSKARWAAKILQGIERGCVQERPAAGFLRPTDLARKQFRSQLGQPGRCPGYRAIYAWHRALARSGRPFEPLPALQESARWLRELREQFGNLGLAAAAYNAGPRRVQDWLAGRGNLPGETRAYVRIITGKPAEEWARGSLEDRVQTEAAMACGDIVRGMFVKALPAGSRESVTIAQQAAWGPWGLQLAGGPSQTRVLADYQQLQKRFASVLGDRAPLVLRTRMAGPGSTNWYLLRIAETTRERANHLCARLEAIGGRCLVFRN
jgi:hypothetical protein